MIRDLINRYLVPLLAGALVAALAVAGVQSWRIDRLKAAPVRERLKTVERVVYRERQAEDITQRVAAHAAEAQAKIVYRTQTVIKEVPVYVTPEIDRRYPLPVGLVRVHDAAALGLDVTQVPDPAGRADDAASDVAASSAGAVIAANYGAAQVCRQRLTDLQDWITQQRALSATAPP